MKYIQNIFNAQFLALPDASKDHGWPAIDFDNSHNFDNFDQKSIKV